MKQIDAILYSKAMKNDKTIEDEDKRVVDQARLYMKKGKHKKVFEKTYFTDPDTSAEEIESVINYGATVGDINYYKYSNTSFYISYVDSAVEKNLYQYLKDRIKWEKNNTLVDFRERQDDFASEKSCLIPASLNISDFNFTDLTDRQIQVIIYYSYGFKDDYVADVLGISKNTVRTHRARGLKKMQKTNNYAKLLDLSQPIMNN